jgi:hypothetical protein
MTKRKTGTPDEAHDRHSKEGDDGKIEEAPGRHEEKSGSQPGSASSMRQIATHKRNGDVD